MNQVLGIDVAQAGNKKVLREDMNKDQKKNLKLSKKEKRTHNMERKVFLSEKICCFGEFCHIINFGTIINDFT